MNTLLRSVDSPQQLSFRVGLPAGASLVEAKDGSGNVEVVDGGAVLATVVAPSARDAAGTRVPVSMVASGDMLTLTVDHQAAEYNYPINVDPAVVDSQVIKNSHWKVSTSSGKEIPFTFYEGESGIEDYHPEADAGFTRGEWGGMAYEAPGDSTVVRVYGFDANGVGNSESQGGPDDIENQLQIRNKTAGGIHETEADIWHEDFYVENDVLCIKEDPGCLPLEPTSETEGNSLSFVQFARESSSFAFVTVMQAADVELYQTGKSTAKFDTMDAEIEGQPNALYGSEHWVNSGKGMVKGIATDPGMGISTFELLSPQEAHWGLTESLLFPSHSSACSGAVCEKELHYAHSLSGLPEGKDTVDFNAGNAAELSNEMAKASDTVYVDNAPPHNITLSGLGSGNEIGEGEYILKVEATDGSGSTPSSGVKSLAMTVDGREVGKPNGSCQSGPCTAMGEWTINGGEFGAGEHKFTVVATDNAGNVATETWTVKVHHATPVSVGPGSVNPQSGELSLGATDVTVSAPGSNLEVIRSYRSRHLTTGSEGPLGPQWSLSVGAEESITKLPNGNVTLVAANGGQTTFVTNGKGGFVSPTGDANLALSQAENAKKEIEYVLKNASRGATTRFIPTSSTSSWKPGKQEGPLASQAVRYLYEPVEGVTEPKYALAPEPAGVTTCLLRLEKKEELIKGCRALEFKYDTSKTATGEGEKQWGEYLGRLKEVLFVAYNPASKVIAKTPVAHYLYDSQGRLRAEWDPRIEPELKTVYGYDAEGHVTAMTPPGQETWAFTYGTISSDSSKGRMIKMTQAPASTGLWKGSLPTDTEAPKLSGSPVVGIKMGISTGVWSNEPVAYGYQWEDCNYKEEACTPILGATNANYTVATSDEGRELVAVVTATNGGGTVSTTVTNGVVGVSAAEYKEPATGETLVITSGSEGNLWYSNWGNGGIGKVTPSGTITEYSLGPEESSEGIIQGPDGNFWFTDYSHAFKDELDESGVGKITPSGTITEYPLPQGSIPGGITQGPDGNLWFTDIITGKIGKITTAGSITEYALPAKSDPYDITSGPDGNLWFTEISGKIGKITTSGSISEYALPSGSEPYGITEGPDGNLWFTDLGTGKIGKITTAGSITEYALPASSEPYKITQGPDGNLWFTDFGTSKVGKITTSGAVTEYTLPAKSYPSGITSGPGGDLWYADAETQKIAKMPPSGNGTPVEGTKYSPGSGTTIEYRVPLSGTSPALPNLTKEEVSKWGQTDVPAEGMAVIAPDEPQIWPATSYKRATIYYLDNKGRTVNISSPTGGISTTEYNTYDDAIRTLSPDNRATSLAAGEKDKEVAKELSTESTYNETGSEPGTELLSTLGPKHNVELTNGTQVEAREHKVYGYNEGAPSEGGPYHLVTTTTGGAEIAGKEEAESVRTTKTSYSGQSNLGWKLREPTSVTTDPTGLDLVHTTEYEPSTGNVIETKMPAASGKDAKVPPAYALQFGKAGKGEGEFGTPADIATDSSGNVWVADNENARVEKFSPEGKYLISLGSKGAGNGQFTAPYGIAINQSTGNIYVGDLEADRIQEFSSTGTFIRAFGSKGSGNGQMSSPGGLAIDASGNVWLADISNNRIEEFSSEGTFIRVVGSKGTGNGQFTEPNGVAISGGNIYVTDRNNNRIEEFSSTGEYIAQFGTKGSGNGQLNTPFGIATSPTSGNLYVADTFNNRVEEFTPAGAFVATFGSEGTGNGQFKDPLSVAVSAAGEVYAVDYLNSRVEKFVPTIIGNEGAHDVKTIYYTTAANTEPGDKECGEHAEWANLPCITKPAAQPGTAGLPELPITKYNSYNIWDEPESSTETVGSNTRTKTVTYDAAGRLKTSATTATVETALPTVTDEYNEKTGALEKQCTNAGKRCTEGKPKTITSVYNTLGELASYTDALEVTSTYEYDIDGRIHKTSDGKGTQTYTYNEAGLLSELVDSSAAGMKFTATYDAEGNMLTESYPNGMNAIYTYNQTGTPTSLVYKKITNCTEEKEKCKWLTDTIVPSIHGQWLSQTSTLSKQAYTYDQAGRLTQVQNTPTGGDCTTRIYGYDEDTNRTSLTTRSSSSKECATEGGSTEWHTYDTADRLLATGIKYTEFGNIDALPALGSEDPEMTSAYYVDNQLSGQKQKEQRIGYNLDPAGRTEETVATGKPLVADIAFNYDGPGDSPSWTNNATASEWSRNIPGINDSLAAIQNNGASPVLQLTNLHGDIIATASTSETATELVSKTDTSEFGAPTTTSSPTYSWLGADGLRTELPSGTINMGARSYVPQLGRFLQPDPIPGGSASAYSYTFGDPVNSSDPSGEYTWGFSAALTASLNAEGQEIIEREAAREAAERAAREAAARAAAEQAQREAEASASAAGPQYETEEGLIEVEVEVESSGGRGGRFRNNEDPGVPPGALCEFNAKYRKAHPKLCHEIESNPWEPAVGFCIAVGWTNPITGIPCGVGGAIGATKSH